MTRLDDLRARYDEHAQQLRDAQDQLAGETFTGSNDDESTIVTVDAQGRFAGVWFNSRLFRTISDSNAIAEGVQCAYDRGYQAMLTRRAELYQPILGSDQISENIADLNAETPGIEDFAEHAIRIGRRLRGDPSGTEQRD